MPENNDKKNQIVQDVVHITKPYDYFGTEIKDQPIFGTKDAQQLGFVPLESAGLKNPIFYMPAKMRDDSQGRTLENFLNRDQWEYLRYAQLDMAGKFEDTLAYREKMGITTDRTLLLGLQYFMLGMLCYSNFNFLIDFNELNRISLKPTSEALKDLYLLNATAMQNLNWIIVEKSTLKSTNPLLGKQLFFDSLKLKNPPEYTAKIGNDYLHRYVYLRDKVLSNQASTPWSYQPYETELTAQTLKKELYEMQSSCNHSAQQK